MEENKEHIYLIQEREFIKTKESIYKLGKTQNIFQRKCGYPKGSVLIFCIHIDKKYNMEKFAINHFNSLFEKQKDIGNEYYKGNPFKMVEELYKIYNNFIKQENELDKVNKVDKVNEVDKVNKVDKVNDVVAMEIEEKIDIENTYEKFIENKNIQKIIIVDYEKETGFYKFPNSIWQELSHKDSEENYRETLNDLIDGNKLLNKDIKNKCHTKDIKYYELKNHEYIILIEHKCCILNAKTKTIIDYDNYMDKYIIKNNFRMSWKSLYNFQISNIDIELVQDILFNIIESKEKIKEFKTFSKNIFVDYNHNNTINSYTNFFYNCHKKNQEPYLSVWLCYIYFILTGEEALSYKDYYNRGQDGWEHFHSINDAGVYELKYIPRIGIIFENYKGISINQQIIELKNIGIKNIIVSSKNFNKSIYKDINLYNVKLFTSNSKVKVMEDIKNVYDIFTMPRLYLNNFIMWIIS